LTDGDLLDRNIQTYQEKLRQNPDSLQFVQLADNYRKKGQLDEASAVCDEGLKKHPGLLSGMLMAGRIYMARRMHAEAADTLKKVLLKEPNNLTAHALLSQALTALGRITEAIAEYQKILALNPEDTSAQKALRGLLDRMRHEGPGAREAGSAQAKPGAERAVEERKPASPPYEIPAYAAADELAERGLYDEAIEAYQHLLEADPDNFIARQKLRELYSMREAMDTPVSVAEPASAAKAETVETQAEKMTDDDILYLLGLMADDQKPGAAPAEAAAKPPAGAKKEAPAPPPPEPPKPEKAVQPASPREEPAGGGGEPGAGSALPANVRAKVGEALNRLASTEGMQQALLVAGREILHSGNKPPASADKLVTLVRVLADVTRRAASAMKQGEAKQVLMFGTQGMAVVSPAQPGILAAVAGPSVKVGLIRLALNDCLKRLSEVK